jgi:hypothetical protein
MRIGQGIKKRWEEEKLKDTKDNKVAPLSHLLKLEYQAYKKLCYWTYEKPLTFGQWLLKPIENLDNN